MDIDSHLIEARANDGTLYFAEVEPGLTFAQAVALIMSGNVTHPVSVLSFNPVEGWCRDVTEDAARELANNSRGEVITTDAIEFIERHAGFDIANEVRLYAEVA